MKIPINNPESAAANLHRELGWTCPEDFTLLEIAHCLDVWVKEEPLKGSEGRILIKGDKGVISINSNITHLGKRNFIIAHEIGHFILHKNAIALFSDTHKTLADWYRNGDHEVQANEFAAELLMPSELFRKKVKSARLNIELINQVSTYFNTSLTATFIRYITHGEFPLMVLFFENGKAKWRHCSTEFPFQYFEYGSSIPPYTVTGDVFYNNVVELHPVKVKAMEWFPDNYKLRYEPQMNLWEQCYKVSDDGLITCLWTL